MAFPPDLTGRPTHPLRPVIPDNACTLRITAAAGTELAGAYSTEDTVNGKNPIFRLQSKAVYKA